jgi:hypothetical protein
LVLLILLVLSSFVYLILFWIGFSRSPLSGLGGLSARRRARQAGQVTPVDQAGAEVEIATLRLDVYDTRQGWWNPEHGDLEIPNGWAYLPTGDAFLTRTVKATGIYWLSWRPRSRNHPHRRLQGLWAPAAAIRAAEERAKQTVAKRAATRAQSERSRARHEQRHQDELREAIMGFLDFSATHAELAEQIAAETASHAAVVGSGRVGRTQLLSLEQKAELAARAHIRHRYTSYHHELDRIPFEAWDEDDIYREVKGAAHQAVDDFLDEHRSMPAQLPDG